jgi:uncharacterized damage-inducible protein DinB
MDTTDLAAYVVRVHGRTREAVERLRDDLVGWRPRPAEFTAGELVRHIANTRRMNVVRLSGAPHTYAGHDIPAGTTVAALLGEVDASAAEAAARLAEVDLMLPVNIAPMGSGFGWQIVLGGLIEHEVHHRSQLCEYLSGMGIEPPALYGLHVEDLPRP